jgi:hypothetical protein
MKMEASVRLRALAIAVTSGVMLLVPLGGIVSLGGIALAAPASPSPASDPAGSSIITIGDSVMLGARWVLEKDGIEVVDAVKNRQASAGSGLLKKRGSNLPMNVVVHLGTNGTFTAGDCRAMIAAAGPTRRVFFLTLAVPRPWEAKNNAVIRNCVAANPGRAFVIDWNASVEQHPKWVYSDGTHLRPAGAKGYSRMIEQAVAAAP